MLGLYLLGTVLSVVYRKIQLINTIYNALVHFNIHISKYKAWTRELILLNNTILIDLVWMGDKTDLETNICPPLAH